MIEKTTVLHISDIHIKSGPDKKFDRSVVLDPLLKRIKEDYNKFQPELVVVTGDIAYKGIKDEYDLAAAFFTDLLDAVKLSPDKIFIVPGNHDVNRKKYRPTDIPSYENMNQLNDELENYRHDLFKGMEDYFNFIKTTYLHLKTIKEDLIPFVAPFKTGSGKVLGIVGLNSAWMCRRSPDEKEIAIGEFQIKTAMGELAKLGATDLNLYLFHHSINYLWPVDKDICRSYIDGDRSILLTGHLHEPAGWIMNDLDGRLVQFQAGGTYLGSESDWPSRYHYITLDWDKNKVRLDFRAYDKSKRKWHVDSRTGDDGHKEFDLFKTSKPEAGGGHGEVKAEARFPDSYRKWISENYQHLDGEKLYGKEMVPLSLPEIFVSLFTDAPADTRGKRKKTQADLKERKPVDLEELVAVRDALLIEGHPGSGKTTLMKHITYCLAREENCRNALEPIKGYLPVLIFMKDLNDYFSGMTSRALGSSTAFEIIDWYCAAKMGATIDGATIQAFIEQGRAVLLLDGFDELLPQHRDVVIPLFANLRIKHNGVKLVLTGRDHGLRGAVFNRFLEHRVRINALIMVQVEEFVKKWFGYFYPGEHSPGGRTANALIKELQVHPAIGALIDNPLMLTAICILYHDQKELPGQRAELYKRFVDNMLYRRFGNESENVLNYLKTLAFTLHTRKTKSTDEIEAVQVLKKVFRQGGLEDPVAYEARIKLKFGEIESQCGLLKFEAGQLLFWHLTFQEFLCADYISDNTTDCIQAIEGYWDDDWYKEMIELYISYISIRSKVTANAIVKDSLEHPDQRRWLKASAALYDIQENRRDYETVVPMAREALQRIFVTEERVDRTVLAEAGELLGWLGDPRDLKAFVPIEGGEYDLEKLGRVTVEPYEIGKYPVVNRWFEEFVKSGGYNEKDYWSKDGLKWLSESNAEYPGFWHDRRWRCPNAPVVGVSWWEADAFCRWLTMTSGEGHVYRLPTGAEWQLAAAGEERRGYAWGNDEDPARCNCLDGKNKIRRTSTVGIFERGRTPDRIYDLSGNVWEWSDEKDGSDRILRGGAYDVMASQCGSALRGFSEPGDRHDYFGFRLARGHR